MKGLWHPLVVNHKLIYVGYYLTGTVPLPERFIMQCREGEYKALVF
jgi:hypothetical protein